MVRVHHINLGVPPELEAAEGAFLVEILGYRRYEPQPDRQATGANWFDADDGTQVHLSLDAQHRPARLAHTAIEVGDQAPVIRDRLVEAGIDFREASLDGVDILICTDPAGNRWELRG
jgi:catechol 2,3-dioxygenase-like lactoylglutathione lyase family enzyme